MSEVIEVTDEQFKELQKHINMIKPEVNEISKFVNEAQEILNEIGIPHKPYEALTKYLSAIDTAAGTIGIELMEFDDKFGISKIEKTYEA